MNRADTAIAADNPKSRVDQILGDLLGENFDLLSEKGRDAAIEAIGSRDPDAGDPAPEAEIEAEVPENKSLSAWEAARGLCAAVQINVAIARLDELTPLSDEDADPFEGEVPGDYAAIRTQVREQLTALRDEYGNGSDHEVLRNINGTLFDGDRPLFERLREAGNFVAAHVNDRTAERQVIRYLAIRALVAMLCRFDLSCGELEGEPEGESRVGAAIAMTERALRCARDTGARLVEELGELGLAADCATDSIPGVEFENGAVERPSRDTKSSEAGEGSDRGEYADLARYRDAPDTNELLVLLKRVGEQSGNWLGTLDRDGKRGARVIRSEIDRLATKAQRYRPKSSPDGKEWPRAARLLSLFATELDRAALELGRLLDP